jgi:urease accessory protein
VDLFNLLKPRDKGLISQPSHGGDDAADEYSHADNREMGFAHRSLAAQLRTMTRTLRIALLVIAAMPALLAHPGHGETGFVAGVAHPLTGFDHLLAMVAVGLLGVRCGGKALWALPITFLMGMLLGGVVSMVGVGMPIAEWGIALSILVFGVMLALVTAPNPWLAGGVIGAFALMHGHAHAADMHHQLSFAWYACGFLLASALLHASGILGGLWLKRLQGASLLRLSGVGIAACSSVFLVELFR